MWISKNQFRGSFAQREIWSERALKNWRRSTSRGPSTPPSHALRLWLGFAKDDDEKDENILQDLGVSAVKILYSARSICADWPRRK